MWPCQATDGWPEARGVWPEARGEPDVALPGHRRGPMGPYAPNVATELEAALAADLSVGLGGRSPPSYPPMGPKAS